jgi:SAM-dependent methyltransferase
MNGWITLRRNRDRAVGSNRDHWEGVGPAYRLEWSSPSKEALSRKELDFVTLHLDPEPATALDIGVGNGRILGHLLQMTQGTQIFGIDIAEAMVNVCRDKFADEDRIQTISVCDISTQPVPFNTHFELITAIRVLKYSQNWAEIVGRLIQHLDDNGSLVFSIPNRHSLSRWSRAYAVPWETTTCAEVRSLARRVDADVVQMAGFGRLPFFAYRSPLRGADRLVTLTEHLLGRMLGPTVLARELLVEMKPLRSSRILHTRSDRVITLEPGAKVVSKTFLGGCDGEQMAAAQGEFRRLEIMAAATAEVDGASSPRPLAMGTGPQPIITMTRCAGQPLLDVLGARRLPPERLERLSTVAAATVTSYVVRAKEPYSDFQFDNMLYDEHTGELGFVDLGYPDGARPIGDDSPLAASLGNLIGSTVFQSARPGWVHKRRQRQQAAVMCAATVRSAAATGSPATTVNDLAKSARQVYQRNAFGGSWLRSLWYATAGYALASRISIGETRFGPVPWHPFTSHSAHLTNNEPRSVPGATNRK